MNMRKLMTLMVLSTGLIFSGMALATGEVTCDSGDPETWQAQEVLQAQLEEKGWVVRRIKVDGGCYEVYALNEKEERVEAYFHPVTLEPVPIKDKH
jgi:hypothetical protein